MYEENKEYEEQKQKIFENAQKVIEIFEKHEKKDKEENQEER